MRSNKPEAREFQDWVTRVVLPSIRETGGYVVGQEKVGVPGEETEAEFMARAHLVAKSIMDRQGARIVALGVVEAPRTRRKSLETRTCARRRREALESVGHPWGLSGPMPVFIH